MTTLSEPTVVFGASDSKAAVSLGLLRRRPGSHQLLAAPLSRALDRLVDRGWKLSVGAMYGRDTVAVAYETGFSSDRDAVVIFEAPSMDEAIAGTVELGEAGWDRAWATEWMIGPREFSPVRGHGEHRAPRDWGFIALWEWNDAWQESSAEQRREYDAECDVAFTSDLASGIDIAGRHRLDWSTSWHHLGVWEADDPIIVDFAMRQHERVADFKLTTSRHYLGRRVPLLDLLGVSHG